MPSLAKRWLFCLLGAAFILYQLNSYHGSFSTFSFNRLPSSVQKWRSVQNIRHPITDFAGLPIRKPKKLPPIQAPLLAETDEAKKIRLERLQAIKDTMKHSWKGYKANAWLKDEVRPLTGGSVDTFGGWAATLVDSLDTLWIMDMKGEFYEAVSAVSKIDFSSSVASSINVFETTIRYLGGFLSAYDLSGERVLLNKAVELAEMLYVAFDTPNRMPVPRWNWEMALQPSTNQESSSSAVLAEVASLCLEFTRIAQITGDSRFYDAIDRITIQLASQQGDSHLPGLWPTVVNARSTDFSSGMFFTIGAMADSAYEYLPKMHMLLGGAEPVYQHMYEKSLAAMKKHIFFRALNEKSQHIVFPGDARVDIVRKEGDEDGHSELTANVQHLGCYAGGMVSIASRLFDSDNAEAAPENEKLGRALTDGCIWAYESTPNGIMPETFVALACNETANPSCTWDEELWLNKSMTAGAYTVDELNAGLEGARHYAERTNLTPGVVRANDRRYLLRPEAIESVFISHRVTGDASLQQHGWNMFQAVVNATRTEIAHAAVENVMVQGARPRQIDNMESFWTAETLKYYYLLFSEPNVISLDEWVLNTEAHPFRRPAAA